MSKFDCDNGLLFCSVERTQILLAKWNGQDFAFVPAKIVSIHSHYEDKDKQVNMRQAEEIITLAHKFVNEEMEQNARERLAKDPSLVWSIGVGTMGPFSHALVDRGMSVLFAEFMFLWGVENERIV